MARTDALPRVRVSEENLVALPALAPYFGFGLVALAVTPVLLFAIPECWPPCTARRSAGARASPLGRCNK